MNTTRALFFHDLRVALLTLCVASVGCSDDGSEPRAPETSEKLPDDGDAPVGTGGMPDENGDGDAPPAAGGTLDFELGETAQGALVVINEFMPSQATVITDPMGKASDFIELFNVSDAPVDLGGYFISDKLDEPLKYRLPAGLVIEAHAPLLLWADSALEEGPEHLPFKLAKEGEAIVLCNPTGDVIDSIDYVNATTDSSFARVPDGSGPWAFCTTPTPGAENDPSCAP